MNSASARISQGFSQVGHSCSHIFMLLYPTVVLALERELRMSYGDLLVLMTLGNVLFGVAALPAGWLGDKWSSPGMMVVFFIGMGASAILTGLMSTPFGLAAGLSLIGLFASIYHPVGTAWLVRNAVNRGKALGVNGVFGSLGVASAALIAGFLTDWLGWRAAFIVPGAISLAFGVALFALLAKGLVQDTKVDVKPQPAPPKGDVVRAFIVMSVTMLCTGLVFQTVSNSLPKIFAERMAAITGGSPAGAGALVSVVYLCAMGAQLAGGHLADRYSLRSIYLLVYLFQIPFYLVAASLYGTALFPVMLAAVLLNTVSIPVENSLLARYTPEKWRGTAFGAKFVLALGVSSLAVPMVAIIHDATGDFYWCFILLAVFAATVVAMSLALPRERPAGVSVHPATSETIG